MAVEPNEKSMAFALQQIRGMSRNDRRAWLNNYFGGNDYDYVNFPWTEATPEEKDRYAKTRAGLGGDTRSDEQPRMSSSKSWKES